MREAEAVSGTTVAVAFTDRTWLESRVALTDNVSIVADAVVDTT